MNIFKTISGSDALSNISSIVNKTAETTVDSKAVTTVTYVIIILIIIAVLAGFKSGILSGGRHLISIIAGFLAVPVISPFIEKIIITALGPTFTFDHPLLNIAGSYALRLLVFSVSLIVVRFFVSSLISLDDLPKIVKIADKIVGGVFGILKVFILIWFIDIVVTKINIIPSVYNTLNASALYCSIAAHNLLKSVFFIN